MGLRFGLGFGFGGSVSGFHRDEPLAFHHFMDVNQWTRVQHDRLERLERFGFGFFHDRTLRVLGLRLELGFGLGLELERVKVRVRVRIRVRES